MAVSQEQQAFIDAMYAKRVPPGTTPEQKKAMVILDQYRDTNDPNNVYVSQYLQDATTKYGISPKMAMQTLQNEGFSTDTIYEEALVAKGRTSELHAEAEAIRDQSVVSAMWQGMTPWDESKGETATLAGVGIMAAEIVVPGVYTARHWNEMSSGERALGIAIDVVSLIPFAGAAARGAKGVSVAGRGARIAGAAKGIGIETIAQLRAPVDMIIHPIATAKSVMRTSADFMENITMPSKIPEAVLTTSDHVVAFRVTDATSPEQALKIRNKLTELAAEGHNPVVEIGGQRIELSVSPLMKESGGGLAHVTPDIEILEGKTVHYKAGLQEKEQGWFLSTEPATTFTKKTALGHGDIPVPLKSGGKVADIGHYRPQELVYLDKQPIRELNLADAVNIPDDIAPQMLNYIKRENGVIYGSMNDWVKVKGAAKPNDIDVVIRNPQKALEEISGIAEKAGYPTRRVPHGLEIKVDGEWVKICDIAGFEGHKKLLNLPIVTNKVDGVRMETLGRQYIAQATGSVSGSAKAAVRAKRLEKAARDVKRMIKEAGITRKKPGIFIVSSKTAGKSINTEKFFWREGELITEMERKLAVGEHLPKVRQRLFTRVGWDKQRVEIWLEKPLSKKQIAKLKGQAIIEDMTAPFKPPVSIKREAAVAAANEYEVNKLVNTLKKAGDLDQARAVQRIAASQRIAPRALEDLIVTVKEGEVPRAEARIDAEMKAKLSKARDEAIKESERKGKTTEGGKRAKGEGDRGSRADTTGRGRGKADEGIRGERTPRTEKPTERTPRDRTPDEDRVPRKGRPPGGDRPPRGGRPPRTPRPPEGEKIPRTFRVKDDTPRHPRREGTREEDKGRARARLPELRPELDEKFVFPKGTKSWKQGFGWWSLMPPYTSENDRVFTRHKPRGAEIVSDEKTAIGTIQAIGGPSADPVKMDMGVIDVYITDPPQKPDAKRGRKAIQFVRDTNKTYSGVKKLKQQKGKKGKSEKKGPYRYKGGGASRKPY